MFVVDTVVFVTLNPILLRIHVPTDTMVIPQIRTMSNHDLEVAVKIIMMMMMMMMMTVFVNVTIICRCY